LASSSTLLRTTDDPSLEDDRAPSASSLQDTVLRSEPRGVEQPSPPRAPGDEGSESGGEKLLFAAAAAAAAAAASAAAAARTTPAAPRGTYPSTAIGPDGEAEAGRAAAAAAGGEEAEGALALAAVAALLSTTTERMMGDSAVPAANSRFFCCG